MAQSKESIRTAIERLEMKTQKCIELGSKYGLNFDDPNEAINMMNMQFNKEASEVLLVQIRVA